MSNRYVLCGGSGAIGQALAKSLVDDGHAVVIISRSPEKYGGPGHAASWDDLASVANGARAIANFAGAPIAMRWTKKNREMIVRSRVKSVKQVQTALAACDQPPALWLQASAIGVYGDRGNEILDDDADPPLADSPQNNFLSQACRQWEVASKSREFDGVRQVITRIGVVMQPDAGAGPVLLRLSKFGLGGRAGNGRQWVPWIDARDLTRVLRFILADDRCIGTLNAVGPSPVTNAELMAAFRKAAGRSFGLPAPVWGLQLGRKLLGVPDEAALASTRVVPRRLESIGFEFHHVTLQNTADRIASGR